MERPLSRQGAECAKVAKQRKEFAFAFLRTSATWHELFCILTAFRPLRRPSCSSQASLEIERTKRECY
jgi:hypothetical protein